MNFFYQKIKEKIRNDEKLTAKDFLLEKRVIYSNNDSIIYFIYKPKNAVVNSIYLELGGTGADPIYPYEIDKNGKISIWGAQGRGDFSMIPNNYLTVFIAKPGIPEVSKLVTTPREYPKEFLHKNALDDRVWRADEVLKTLINEFEVKPKVISVWGYSEGFYVASKLATINDAITHLGIGGGGGLNDMYDFMLFNSISAKKGEISMEEFKLNTDTLLMEFEKVMKNPNSIENDGDEYTNKRWASYSEPPIYQLMKLDIPIFVAGCLYDTSCPIESLYIVPLEFIRLGKTNLDFRVYPYEHSFIEKAKTGEIYHYKEVIKEYIEFIKKIQSCSHLNKLDYFYTRKIIFWLSQFLSFILA